MSSRKISNKLKINIICSIFSLDDRHLRGDSALASDLKVPPESDSDSIADYADGDNSGNDLISSHMCRVFITLIIPLFILLYIVDAS